MELTIARYCTKAWLASAVSLLIIISIALIFTNLYIDNESLAEAAKRTIPSQLWQTKISIQLPLWSLFDMNPILQDVSMTSEQLHLSRSQDAEDKFAFDNFFYRKANGTFIELGAIDGFTISNTWAFEKQLGWFGVLIEGSAQAYSRLVYNRPTQVAVHAVICSAHKIVHFSEKIGVGGVPEFMTVEFMEYWHKDVLQNGTAFLPEVTCVPLTDILNLIRIQHYNWFVLDVGGAEYEVTASIDFSKYRFDVITVEILNQDIKRDDALRELIKSRGYRLHSRQIRNDWFVHNDFTPSHKPGV